MTGFQKFLLWLASFALAEKVIEKFSKVSFKGAANDRSIEVELEKENLNLDDPQQKEKK